MQNGFLCGTIFLPNINEYFGEIFLQIGDIMRFLPIQKFELITPYDAERITSILKRNMCQNQKKTGTYYQLPTAKDGKLLDGKLLENGFLLKEYVEKKEAFYNKNSFEAVAEGTYKQGLGKTTIQVKLGLSKGSKIAFSIWSGLICFVVLISIVSMVHDYASSTLWIVIATLLMMLFGYLMMLVSFRTSANKLERRIRDVLGRGKVWKD